MAKFINPFTDIGFKRIFGQEVSKPVMITFLNSLLDGERHIVDLQYLDKEKIGISRTAASITLPAPSLSRASAAASGSMISRPFT